MNVEKDSTSSAATKVELKENGEAALNSGLNSKQIEVFWQVVWPQLLENGWEKITTTPSIEDNAGTSTSIILATSRDLDLKTGIEGKDYYVSIKDALDRINERRNAAESTAADRYRRAVSKPEKPLDPDFAPSFTRPRRAKTVTNTRAPEHSPRIDLSWKEGGEVFPKKSSSVGEEFQVSTIPEAGTFSKKENPSSDTYCELVWDPQQARQKGILLEDGKDIISKLGHNIREPALIALASVDYSVEAFQSSVVKDLKPTDGSNWSQEQKDRFHAEVFRHRRDLRKVTEIMDIPMKTCHAYYLASYKSTCEYRLLKTVCIEEREQKDEDAEHGVDACAVCGEGGSLLICDRCDGEYHMTCLRPVLADIPAGHWECDECVDSRVLEARNFLIRKTALFEKVRAVDISKKRSFGKMQNAGNDEEDSQVSGKEASEPSGKVIFRPVAPAVAAVRKFASQVSVALSKT